MSRNDNKLNVNMFTYFLKQIQYVNILTSQLPILHWVCQHILEHMASWHMTSWPLCESCNAQKLQISTQICLK